MTAHVAYNTGQSDWYTPAPYVEAARRVMGGIDLDPASAQAANDEVVKATTFYSEEDDGRGKEWRGRVWMNPPFTSALMRDFCNKLVESHRSGDVSEACVLVNNATETKSFAVLAGAAAAVCFVTGRIKFWHPTRDSKTPLQGQCILYFGWKKMAFVREFSGFGHCWFPIDERLLDGRLIG